MNHILTYIASRWRISNLASEIPAHLEEIHFSSLCEFNCFIFLLLFSCQDQGYILTIKKIIKHQIKNVVKLPWVLLKFITWVTQRRSEDEFYNVKKVVLPIQNIWEMFQIMKYSCINNNILRAWNLILKMTAHKNASKLNYYCSSCWQSHLWGSHNWCDLLHRRDFPRDFV